MSSDGPVTSFPPSARSRSSHTLSPKSSRAKEGDARPGRALTVGGGGGSPETLCTRVYCKSSRKSLLQSEGQ